MQVFSVCFFRNKHVLFLALLMSFSGYSFSQDNDTTGLSKNIEYNTLSYRFTADMFTSFSILHTINALAGNEPGNIYLFYNATLTGDLRFKKFAYSIYFYTDYGMKFYFDSINVISDDQFDFKNGFSYQLSDSKFALNISHMSKSQFYQHYFYEQDSTGKLNRVANSSYLSPGYRNFSVGVKYSLKKMFLELGLVNGMRTIVKNQVLYDNLETDELFGLKRGEYKKLDYGFNLVLTFPMQLLAKNFYLENFSQFSVVNKDLRFIGKYNFDINNAFHYIFLKHFRLTLRTKCQYNYNISLKPVIINNLTFGFYINNKL